MERLALAVVVEEVVLIVLVREALAALVGFMAAAAVAAAVELRWPLVAMVRKARFGSPTRLAAMQQSQLAGLLEPDKSEP